MLYYTRIHILTGRKKQMNAENERSSLVEIFTADARKPGTTIYTGGERCHASAAAVSPLRRANGERRIIVVVDRGAFAKTEFEEKSSR